MEKKSIRQDANIPVYGGTTTSNPETNNPSSVTKDCQKCQKCQIREKTGGNITNTTTMKHGQFSSTMGAKILAAASTSQETGYNALCACQELGQPCNCKQNQNWSTSKWKPQNWNHWPLVKKTLIIFGFTALCIWLLVYLIFHFYLARQD